MGPARPSIAITVLTGDNLVHTRAYALPFFQSVRFSRITSPPSSVRSTILFMRATTIACTIDGLRCPNAHTKPAGQTFSAGKHDLMFSGRCARVCGWLRGVGAYDVMRAARTRVGVEGGQASRQPGSQAGKQAGRPTYRQRDIQTGWQAGDGRTEERREEKGWQAGGNGG